MNDNDQKKRDIVVAENESERQTTVDIRVSTWAIAVAVLIGLAIFGWVALRS